MPKIEYHENEKGELRVTLHEWDTIESVDGYSVEEIDHLVNSLTKAKEHLINNSDSNQGKLFDAKEFWRSA